MASEVEESPRLVTGGYGQHKSQWVNLPFDWFLLMIYWRTDTFSFLFLCHIMQIDSMLPCIFSLIYNR